MFLLNTFSYINKERENLMFTIFLVKIFNLIYIKIVDTLRILKLPLVGSTTDKYLCLGHPRI